MKPTLTFKPSQLKPLVRQSKTPSHVGKTGPHKAAKKPQQMKPLSSIMQGLSAELNSSDRARAFGNAVSKHKDSPNITAWLNGNFTTT